MSQYSIHPVSMQQLTVYSPIIRRWLYNDVGCISTLVIYSGRSKPDVNPSQPRPSFALINLKLWSWCQDEMLPPPPNPLPRNTYWSYACTYKSSLPSGSLSLSVLLSTGRTTWMKVHSHHQLNTCGRGYFSPNGFTYTQGFIQDFELGGNRMLAGW